MQEIPPLPRLRLLEARLSRGFSQQDVAEQIQTTHVNVSRWERGVTKPHSSFRRKLSKLFALSEEELDLIPPTLVAATTREKGSATTSRTNTVATIEPIHMDLSPIYDPAIPLRPSHPLVGRAKELTQIKTQLQNEGSAALTALNGLPGVGKTALSVALAHDPEIRAHFKDGILWAGLGPNPNMPGLLSRWGTLLGISANQMTSLNTNEAWAKAIRTAIGMRSMLLVIDDAWQLEDALLVRVGGQHCAHLITTRIPTIAAHITINGATMIQELGEDESIALLRQLAPQVVNREVQKVSELVQAVGGLPLALTLMGNYLRKQTSSGPARRISATLERLSNAETRLHIEEPHVPAESYPALTIETPLSLQSVIAVTDQMLSKAAQATLYALAVFPSKPNTFSEEAALAVTACTTDELDALSDSGLLEINGGERYQLHQIIADYARFNLRETKVAETQKRLIAYIADFVEKHKKDYEQLEVESSTILATLDITSKSKQEAQLVRIVNAFAPFLVLRGFYSQAERYLQQAHTAASAQQDIHGVIGILISLGEIAQKQGLNVQAEAHFQEGLALARQIEDLERICALLAYLGGVTWKLGEYSQAEAYLQEGLALARQIENPEHICALLKILGSVFATRGDYTQSEIYLQEGVTIAQQIGDREQSCILLMNLGATLGTQGRYAQAEKYFQEGLILARQIGDKERISALLGNLGEASGYLGHYAKAELYIQEGLLLARQIGHPEWISTLLTQQGQLARKLKKFLQADIYLQESLEIASTIGRPQLISEALYQHGDLYLDLQKIVEAEKCFREMLTIAPEGSIDQIALAQYGLARIAKQRGNQEEGRQLGLISITTLEKIKHHLAPEARDWLNTISS
jgi:tetratricopeptide (TPR) repeat protein/transcriptional regulator with XRE-family HTH domain